MITKLLVFLLAFVSLGSVAYANNVLLPNIPSSCLDGQYVSGFDSNGDLICKQLPTSTGTPVTSSCPSGIKEVLYGQVLPEKFYTTSKTYVDTGFPANPVFTKQYNESQIWMFYIADNSNTQTGAVNAIRIFIDDFSQTIWGRVMANGNRTDTFTGITIATVPHLDAGEHTVKFMMRVSTGNGTLGTKSLNLHIYEVCFN